MSTQVTIVSCVLLVVLLCTLHLLLGVWVGSIIRGRWQFAAQAADTIVVRACSELQAQLRETAALRNQAENPYQFCARRVPALPAEHAVQTYGDRPFSISSEEFRNMTDNTNSSDSESHVDRYRYDVMQYIAPFDGHLPAVESFKQVRCRDLARGGFSYFLETVPDYESLVVALGNPPDLTFLIAQIQHHRPGFIDGQRGYLVGCQFVRQVAGDYAWDADLGGIISKTQSETAIVS